MSDKLQKRTKDLVSRDLGQYSLTIGVTGVVLWAVGVPFFAIFFLGAFSFFLLKIFTSDSRGESRRIFEFYLQASEILRGDGRQWFGFELRNAIAAGERILKEMPDAPPLVRFALGALYHKIHDPDSAILNIEQSLGDIDDKEFDIVVASPALTDYVRILRKIEREPGESPRTAAAVRLLQRMRKSRARTILAECREKREQPVERKQIDDGERSVVRTVFYQDDDRSSETADRSAKGNSRQAKGKSDYSGQGSNDDEFHGGRKTISEVLQDIYDDKVQ